MCTHLTKKMNMMTIYNFTVLYVRTRTNHITGKAEYVKFSTSIQTKAHADVYSKTNHSQSKINHIFKKSRRSTEGT